MTNDPMTENRELDLWREQWSSVARPSPEFQRQVQRRIKVQDRRFWLGNLLAVAALVGMLILAVYQLSHQASRLEKGAASAACVLLFVAVTCRLWFLWGTWRAETQSIRAFVELWHRRVLSQIRRLQIGIYLAIGWIVFCAALAAANWATIRLQVMAHPTACLVLMVVIVLMLRVIWFGAMWLRRRKVAELNEVTRLLEEMEIMND
ncbi:MAG: hypothetical protein WB660_16805 [Candidatus Sulfotelmatobacter sp.]